jgi:hypothetical protein
VEKSNTQRLTKIYFWCRKCRKDFELIGIKKVKSSRVGEVWTAKCPECKRELVRLINNPKDPYYRLSAKVRIERKKYAKDLLQIGDPGFDTLYPQHKKKREEYYKNLEEQKWKKK